MGRLSATSSRSVHGRINVSASATKQKSHAVLHGAAAAGTARASRRPFVKDERFDGRISGVELHAGVLILMRSGSRCSMASVRVRMLSTIEDFG